jgi:hypothetical protein
VCVCVHVHVYTRGGWRHQDHSSVELSLHNVDSGESVSELGLPYIGGKVINILHQALNFSLIKYCFV